MTETLPTTEWWWPSPESFKDLTVTDIETGWELSAPDGTELAAWIEYWNQSEEHHELFQTVFLKALTDHANFVIDDLEKNGENEGKPDGGQAYREQAEEDIDRSEPEHEPGSDSLSTQAS